MGFYEGNKLMNDEVQKLRGAARSDVECTMTQLGKESIPVEMFATKGKARFASVTYNVG